MTIQIDSSRQLRRQKPVEKGNVSRVLVTATLRDKDTLPPPHFAGERVEARRRQKEVIARKDCLVIDTEIFISTSSGSVGMIAVSEHSKKVGQLQGPEY